MKAIKVLLALTALVAIFIIAELVYIVHNRPELLIDIAFRLTNSKVTQSTKSDNVEQKIVSLVKLAELRIKGMEKDEPALVTRPEIAGWPSMDDKPILKQAYAQILSETDEDQLILPNSQELVIFFYRLGLEAYRLDELDFVVPAWQIATYLAPQWAYFHQELVNYYLQIGQIDKGRQALKYCLLFDYPRKSCQHYVDYNFVPEKLEPVGFLEQVILTR